MFGPLCQTTNQGSIDLHDLRNPYPKQWTIGAIWTVHALSLWSSHLHKLLVGLIVYNYRFQIWLAWLVFPCLFYWQVSGSIAKTGLKQKKWLNSVLSNARDRTNPVVIHNPPIMIQVVQRYEKNIFSVSKSIKSRGFLMKMSKQTVS